MTEELSLAGLSEFLKHNRETFNKIALDQLSGDLQLAFYTVCTCLLLFLFPVVLNSGASTVPGVTIVNQLHPLFSSDPMSRTRTTKELM